MLFLTLLSWLKNNWFILAFIGFFLAGWHGHAIYDGYYQEKQETKLVDNLGKGEVEIVKVNQALDNDKNLKKDDCATRAMPSSVVKLLH